MKRSSWRCRRGYAVETRSLWWRFLPSLTLCSVLVLHGLLNWVQPEVRVANRYEAAAREAVEREDYRSAAVFYRKLLKLGHGAARTRLRLAVCLLRTDRRAHAQVILDQISPADDAGLPDGHWLQATLIRPAQHRETPDLLLHHLRCATRSQFSEQAHALLASYHLHRGETQHAAAHARHACARCPNWAYWLARHSRNTGDIESARRHVPAAIGHLQAQLRESPHDIFLRCALTECLRWNHQFATAEAVLREGMKGGPHELLKRSLATLYHDVWIHLPTWEPPSRRLLVLQNGLASTAEFPDLRRQFWSAIEDEAGQGSIADFKRIAESDNDAAPLARYLLAVALLEEGKFHESNTQFRRAQASGFPVREAFE